MKKLPELRWLGTVISDGTGESGILKCANYFFSQRHNNHSLQQRHSNLLITANYLYHSVSSLRIPNAHTIDLFRLH